jgi:hypothetical protein
MSEAEFTRIVLSKIRPLLSDPWRIESRMSILYAISINEGGDVQLNVNDKGRPIRGRGTGFEQDILLYEEVDGQTSVLPRVAIEVKCDRVTTHDALVYSEKARRIRTIYPYLRYGFLLGGVPTVPPRVLRLGNEFDFIIALSGKPTATDVENIVDLIKKEAELSRHLGRILQGEAKVTIFHRGISTVPDVPSPDEHDNFTKADSTTKEEVAIRPTARANAQRTYYFYENWTAEEKAKIHYDSCSYCNYGKGIHPNATARNGKWHGPFGTYETAYRAAKGTGRPVSNCKICHPQ